MCLLEGLTVTPEMPGICYKCCLYLNTCMPIVSEGMLVASECTEIENYCEFCSHYEECGK